MTLAVYIDESDAGDGQGISLVAGLAAPPMAWYDISEKWSRVCLEAPSNDYYKFGAIKSQRWAQQYGLNSGDAEAKTDNLSALLFPTFTIDTCALGLTFQASSSVQIKAFERHISSRRTPRATNKAVYKWLTNPYYFCFIETVRNVLWHVHEMKERCPTQLHEEITEIDFFVDEDKSGVSRHAENLFASMKNVAPEPIRRIMGTCVPLDDKHTPAIQAADMLAGHLMQYQREWQKKGVTNPPGFSTTHLRLAQIEGRQSEWTCPKLKQFADHLSNLPEPDWLGTMMSEPISSN